MPSARTLAAQLPQAAPGSRVQLEGWVHRRRVLATVTFLVVRDRSGLAQVVVRDRRALPECGEETVISVTGVATRAEPHDTARHLAEYVSLDAELGFISDHRDVLAVLRHALAGMASAVRASQAAGLLGIAIPDVPEEIPVIHFSEALELAGAPPDETDLAPAHERAVGRWAAETHGSEFVAVEGYPMRKRPFYTHPQPGDERWSNSFDLLFRGVELVTGGQRLHRHSDYVAAIRARGEDPSAYSDYLEAFATGMPPHGGFAIGLERWTARLTQADNIRDVTLFPRDLHRLTP